MLERGVAAGELDGAGYAAARWADPDGLGAGAAGNGRARREAESPSLGMGVRASPLVRSRERCRDHEVERDDALPVRGLRTGGRTASHDSPRLPTTLCSSPHPPTASHNSSQPPTTSHHFPLPPTTSHGLPQPPTTSLSPPQLPTASHGIPQPSLGGGTGAGSMF